MNIPKVCPICKSDNIIGKGLVVGETYISLTGLIPEKHVSNPQIVDLNDMKYHCFECGNDFGNMAQISQNTRLIFALESTQNYS